MAPTVSVALSGAFAVAGAARLAAADLTVMALGDWGGENDGQPTTESQWLTAQGMRRIAHEVDANLTLLMGDNFYQHGISGDDLSSRFETTFEAVYAELIPGRPFYAFAGNHDYGQGLMGNVSAQVAYSQRSAQWSFPSLWYTVHRTFDTTAGPRTLDVIVLDTVVLCGNGPENEALIDEQLRFVGGAFERPRGASLREAAAEAQWAWLEQQLAASSADYLWAAGHYPIWSAGSDGSYQCLIDRLLPMLAAHKAHYISGHDHMLEHFVHAGVNSFVIGAGKECCYPAENYWQVPPGSARYLLAGHLGNASQPAAPFPVYGGFASLRFGPEVATVTLHAHDGTALYVAPPIPRRTAWATLEPAQVRRSMLAIMCVLALVPSFVLTRLILAERTIRRERLISPLLRAAAPACAQVAPEPASSPDA